MLTGCLARAVPITVQSSNRAPSISGAPTTSATAGQAYSFQPSASDPDGKHVDFLDLE